MVRLMLNTPHNRNPAFWLFVKDNTRLAFSPAESPELESLIIRIWCIFLFVLVTEDSNFKIILKANILLNFWCSCFQFKNKKLKYQRPLVCTKLGEKILPLSLKSIMVFVVFPNIIETVWRRKLSVACLPGLQVQGWAPAWLWTVKKHLRKKGRKGWGDIPGRNEPLNQNVEARARWWWASREKDGNSKWELRKRPPMDSPAQEQEDFFKIYLFFFVHGGSSLLH